MPTSRPKLRLGTYLCPSHPVELYELFLKYLEEELPCEATLMYESRAGGPLPDREDPFTADALDIGRQCRRGCKYSVIPVLCGLS